MTCNHEPEDRLAGEPTTCRHCRVEIEAIPCEECGGGVAHWREVGAAVVPACDATGREGWREVR